MAGGDAQPGRAAIDPAPMPSLPSGCGRRGNYGRSSSFPSLPLPVQRKSLQQIIQLQLRRLPPIEDRLDDVRREQRQPQDPADVGRATPLARARSSSVACTPSSSIFRHRNARASALTMALSIRGRGAHSAPSGVTTSFRPPRFLNVSGMWTVIVSPSAETVARVHAAALLPRNSRTARRSVRPKADATTGRHRP